MSSLEVFVGYLFLVVALLCGSAKGYCAKKASGLLLITAAALFGNSFFKTESAKHLDAAILFPLTHGCALMLSSAMAALFFKERITWKSILGLALIFFAMVIINL